MGASSAGLGCGTTVYFELPLFSAATAGKQSSDRDRELPSQVMSTPERKKPRPSSPPLTGSAIYVVDTVSDEGEASPSYQLLQKPKRGLLRYHNSRTSFVSSRYSLVLVVLVAVLVVQLLQWYLKSTLFYRRSLVSGS